MSAPSEDYLSAVREILELDICITKKGNELKGWTLTPEGSEKFYVSAAACFDLAAAFEALGNVLESPNATDY